MISSVSFRAAQPAGNFKDLINKPQAYSNGTKPQAASKISNGDKKGGKVKKVLIGAGIIAAIAAGLALMATKGQNLLQPGENQFLNTIKSGIDKAGTAIVNGFSKVKNLITNNSEKIAEEASTIAEEVVETV